MGNIYVLYRGGSADGFGSALAAWLSLREEAKYVAVPMPPAKGALEALPDRSDVYILDWSPPAEELRALCDRARVAVVLDHGRQACVALEGFMHPRSHVTCTPVRCGAHLAWRFFHPQGALPALVRYLEDAELELWKLPESREVAAALAEQRKDFEEWMALLDEDGVEALRVLGRPLVAREETRSAGAERIAAERRRQIEEEGWTPENDDHSQGDLRRGAEAYLVYAMTPVDAWRNSRPRMWPWDNAWWKPSDDPVRNLEKAGALIAAEIDRLLRAKGGAAC